MERKPNRFLVGCLIWLVGFLIISSCLVPAGMLAGGLTMFFSEDLITSTVGTLMCPSSTVPEIISFETTRIDEDGFERPSTSFEMVCKTPDGNVVKNSGGLYALIWNGFFIALGIILSMILAAILTILIQRLLKNKSEHNSPYPPTVKIE